MSTPQEQNVQFDFKQEIADWVNRNDIGHTELAELKLIFSNNTNISTIDRCRDTMKKMRGFMKDNGLAWSSEL